MPWFLPHILTLFLSYSFFLTTQVAVLKVRITSLPFSTLKRWAFSSLCPVLEPFNSHSDTATRACPDKIPSCGLLLTWLFHSSLCGCFNWHLLSLLKPACSGTTFYFVFIKMQCEYVKLCHLCGDIKGCRNHCACFSPLFLSFSCLCDKNTRTKCTLVQKMTLLPTRKTFGRAVLSWGRRWEQEMRSCSDGRGFPASPYSQWVPAGLFSLPRGGKHLWSCHDLSTAQASLPSGTVCSQTTVSVIF